MGNMRAAGIPMPGVEIKVVDEHGESVPPNTVGEIVTRGLHVMKGYLHNPEATASAFTGDWLHTGDLGYFDEDGFLFIVSRKKGIDTQSYFGERSVPRTTTNATC